MLLVRNTARIASTREWGVAISVRLQIRLEDRFPRISFAAVWPPVPLVWYIPSALSPPPGFGIITLRTGCGGTSLSCSSSRPFSHSVSRPSDSISSKLFPSTPGAPCLAFASVHAPQQNGLPRIYLVVKLIETESRLLLRLSIQLALKSRTYPYFRLASTPVLSSFTNTPEQGCVPIKGTDRVLPSPALPGFAGTVWTFPTPDGPPPFRRFAGRDPSDPPGLPH